MFRWSRGAGLGHTGGTLDKLESIPGYRTEVSEEEFAKVVSDVGCAIVGAGRGLLRQIKDYILFAT